MKWNKRLLATAAALVLALSAAGCGGGGSTGGDQAADAESLIKQAQETMAGVNSMKSDMTVEMAMSAGEESMEMTTKATVLTMEEPLKMQMDISATMGEETVQDLQMFVSEADGQLMSYMNVSGQWYAVPTDAAELEQYNAEEDMSLYLDNISSFSVAGEEDVNGAKATKITGVIAGDAMKEAVESSGALDSISSMGVSEEEVQAMYDELGDLPVSLWIDAEGHVVKYELDMSVMMQTIMDKAMAAAVEQAGENAADVTIEISKMLITMDCSDFNAVEDIEIPAEALEAQVLQ